MKPLPRQNADTLRQLLLQVSMLLKRRNWSAAYETLGVLGHDTEQWRDTPEFGEWCLLRAQSAVELARYKEAVQFGRQALTRFDLSADNERFGMVQAVLSRAYLGLGDTKNARIQARDALGTYRRINDIRGMAQSHNNLARIHFMRGEYGVAAEHLNDGLELYRRLGDTGAEARLLGNLGRIHLLNGNWSEAEAVLVKALVCAKQDGNRVSMARNYLSLAFVTTLRHDFKAAAEHLDSALVYVEQAELARERSIYHEYTGWWHFEQRHWIQAKESFHRALNIGRCISAQNDLVSQSLRGLAECEAELSAWRQAERLSREGLDVAIKIGERSEVGCLYRVRARALAQLGDGNEARACLDKAFECLEMVGDVYELARCDIARAEVNTVLGDPAGDETRKALTRAAKRLESLSAFDQLHAVQWAIVDACRRTGDFDDALALARELDSTGLSDGHSNQHNDVLHALADSCLKRAVSEKNEFRWGGMPWLPNASRQTGRDALQQCIDFYRTRLDASRVVLLELTSAGKRSGTVLATAGAEPAFAERLAVFAASTYQKHLLPDEPRVYWSIESIPDLAASLAGPGEPAPCALISIPVELGPGADGLLYADIQGTSSHDRYFKPRDVEFAVAFADVVAWHSTRLRSEGLFRDVQRLRDQVGRESDFPSILTRNADFRQVLARARLIVDADVSVLLQGETGTGKDLLAKAIHYTGVRRDRRFVSVNCAALPESLLESELFGAKRGAFTGADRDRVGLFEEADGGTFFLDEIGEMPLSIQAKLLRFLETKEFLRLGDSKPRHVDVRIISATNRDLAEDTERGTFRRDLYYRLSPVTFKLPPLAERPEDVPLLIDHFLARNREETGRHVTLTPETLRLLCAYRWPGNVRELDNEIRKLVLLSCADEMIGPDRLSSKFHDSVVEPDPTADMPIPDGFHLYDYVSRIEQRYINRAMAETGGIKKHAARRLGIPESTLRLKLKQFDLDMSR